MVKRFNNQDCPATGFSIGLDRLLFALKQKELFNFEEKKPILICVLDKNFEDYYFKILNLLRSNNINSEIYSGNSNFKSQLKYADKRGCKFVIICGEDEVKNNKVTLKNLDLGKNLSKDIKDRDEWKESSSAQVTIPINQLLEKIKN